MGIGGVLKRLREDCGLTVEQVSSHLGVSRDAIFDWEGGARVPDLVGLAALADPYSAEQERLPAEKPGETPAFAIDRLAVSDLPVFARAKRTAANLAWLGRILEGAARDAAAP